MANERIILGIDPGTTIMGFGLIKVVNKKMEFVQLNELILSKYDNHYQKLRVIFERTIELIDTLVTITTFPPSPSQRKRRKILMLGF